MLATLILKLWAQFAPGLSLRSRKGFEVVFQLATGLIFQLATRLIGLLLVVLFLITLPLTKMCGSNCRPIFAHCCLEKAPHLTFNLKLWPAATSRYLYYVQA